MAFVTDALMHTVEADALAQCEPGEATTTPTVTATPLPTETVTPTPTATEAAQAFTYLPLLLQPAEAMP